ncbi:MAG: tetratricopeptide repeat protein [Cyanobacteria bacterium J06635_15]
MPSKPSWIKKTLSRFIPPFLRGAGGIATSAHTPQTTPDPTEEFISLNEEAIEKLATFIDFAEGFTIGFVEINFLADLDILIQHLATHPDCADAQFITLTLDDPNLRFLKDELVKRLANETLVPDKKPIIWIQGLEQSIHMSGDYPPMLNDLNFVRDAFVDSVPHPVLFCLPDYAINRVIQYAPDFWSWKSGLFRFKTRPSTQKFAADSTIFSDRIRESLLLEDWQERIDQLERLVMEYRPSGSPTPPELENYCWVLSELGIAYRGQGNVTQAAFYLRQAIDITENQTSAQSQRALALHELGILKANQGEIEDAIALYQQSLDIKEQIGDIKTKAATLHQLAILKANQGKIEDAIALYQQSLDITEQIGDIQTKAATLNQLGILKADQGEIEDAIALYQEVLAIDEQTGNIQGKAATLHQLGMLKANQGEIEDAIALFQESLNITEKIGDIQTKSMTLQWIGGLAADVQKDYETGIQCFRESLEILQRIGSPKAENAERQLAQIQALAAEQATTSEP